MPVEFPVFVDQPSVDVELQGVRGSDGRATTRTVTLHPISLPVAARLARHLGAPMAKALDALVTGQGHEVRQAAVGGLIESLGAQPQLVAMFVLDALQAPGQDGAKAQPTTKDCEAFLAGTPAPAMAHLFGAALQANKEGFAPFFDRLLEVATSAGMAFLEGFRQKIEDQGKTTTSASVGGSAS